MYIVAQFVLSRGYNPFIVVIYFYIKYGVILCAVVIVTSDALFLCLDRQGLLTCVCCTIYVGSEWPGYKIPSVC